MILNNQEHQETNSETTATYSNSMIDDQKLDDDDERVIMNRKPINKNSEKLQKNIEKNI